MREFCHHAIGGFTDVSDGFVHKGDTLLQRQRRPIPLRRLRARNGILCGISG